MATIAIDQGEPNLHSIVPVAVAAKEMGRGNKEFKRWAKRLNEEPKYGIKRKKKDRWSNKMLTYYEVFYLRSQVDRIIKEYRKWKRDHP